MGKWWNENGEVTMLLRVQSYTSSVVPASDVIPSMMITEHKQWIAIFWRLVPILNEPPSDSWSTIYIEAYYSNEVIPHGLCKGSVVDRLSLTGAVDYLTTYYRSTTSNYYRRHQSTVANLLHF